MSDPQWSGEQLEQASWAGLVRRVRNRVRRKLRQMGKWPEDRDATLVDAIGGTGCGDTV
jgi:hypothetical protein